MSIWKYNKRDVTGINETLITNTYLRDRMDLSKSQADFTPEAIYYLRELLHPFIIQLNAIASPYELHEYYENLPYSDPTFRLDQNLENAKFETFNSIIQLLTWHKGKKPGIQKHKEIINPWVSEANLGQVLPV